MKEEQEERIEIRKEKKKIKVTVMIIRIIIITLIEDGEEILMLQLQEEMYHKYSKVEI